MLGGTLIESRSVDMKGRGGRGWDEGIGESCTSAPTRTGDAVLLAGIQTATRPEESTPFLECSFWPGLCALKLYGLDREHSSTTEPIVLISENELVSS